MAEKNKKNLKSNLQHIAKIVEWFESQEEIDLEEALLKVKEAEEYIRVSKERLKEIDNEFREIKKKMEE